MWNPGAAVAWSLLLSPIFGSIIHMKNWESLGELQKAERSKTWVLGSICFFVFLVLLAALLPESKALETGSRGASVGLLVAWYSLSARAQVSYVKARFGGSYIRKAWALPFLYTVLCFIAFVAVFVVASLVIGVPQGEC